MNEIYFRVSRDLEFFISEYLMKWKIDDNDAFQDWSKVLLDEKYIIKNAETITLYKLKQAKNITQRSCSIWCTDNCIGKWSTSATEPYVYDDDVYVTDYYFNFELEEDAVRFKLTGFSV